MTDYFAETRVYCVSLKRQARKKRVLALGFFDSVHVGHRKIIDFSMKIASDFELIPSIYTFDNDFFRALGTDEKLVFTQKRDSDRTRIQTRKYHCRNAVGRSHKDERRKLFEFYILAERRRRGVRGGF